MWIFYNLHAFDFIIYIYYSENNMFSNWNGLKNFHKPKQLDMRPESFCFKRFLRHNPFNFQYTIATDDEYNGQTMLLVISDISLLNKMSSVVIIIFWIICRYFYRALEKDYKCYRDRGTKLHVHMQLLLWNQLQSHEKKPPCTFGSELVEIYGTVEFLMISQLIPQWNWNLNS